MLEKIITVYPLNPGSGSKYASTALAHRYKELNPTHKVAVIDLNLLRPYLGYGFIEKSNISRGNLDSFVSVYDLHCNNGKVEHFQLSQLFIETQPNIFFLGGSKEFNQRRHIRTEHIEYLIHQASLIFDMVFLSVATDVDNPATIVALCNSWKVLVIGKHNHATFEGFIDGIERIKPYVNMKNVKFVYNCYDEKQNFHFGDFVILYDIDVLGFLYYDSKTIDSKNFKKGFVKKSIFGRKSKNEQMFSEIIKNLLKK